MKIDVTYVNGVPDQFIASHGEQIKNEIQNALSCSQVPNSADSFQLSKHIAMASMVNDYCIDSGVANSYIAQVSGSYQNPTNLTTGMEIKLNALNANTGASTLNLASLGAKDIKKSDGVTDIEAGDIIVGDNYLKYNGTCWCLKSAVFDELYAKTQDTSDNSKKVATTEYVNILTGIKKWNSLITFGLHELCIGDDFKIYVSQISNNLNNNPTTDTTNWKTYLYSQRSEISGFGMPSDSYITPIFPTTINDLTTYTAIANGEVIVNDWVDFTNIKVLTVNELTNACATFGGNGNNRSGTIQVKKGDIVKLYIGSGAYPAYISDSIFVKAVGEV